MRRWRRSSRELIYCAISGYGQTGPSSQLPAYAPVIHAASGYDLAHLAYQMEERRPDYCGIYIADVLTGTYAFGAIMAALHQRQLTGRGQLIDVSMLESMLTLTLSEIQAAQFAVPPPGRPVFGPIATKDGYINLSVASERTFQNLAVASGHPQWITDPPLCAVPRPPRQLGRIDRRARALVEGAQRRARCRRSSTATVCPPSPYRTVREAMADPQLAHRGASPRCTTAAAGFRCSTRPSGSRRCPPRQRPTPPRSARIAKRYWQRSATRRPRSGS